MRAFIILLAVAIVLGDSVDDLCPPNNGVSPVYLPSEDCSKFYECSNGIARLLQCPDDLQYNAKLNVCDWPESAGCEGSGDNTTEQPTETTPAEDTTERSSEESTEKPSEESNKNSTSSEDSKEGKSSEESNDKSNDGQSTEESTEQPSEESNENSKSSEDSKEGKSSDESSRESDDELIRKACESNEFFLVPHPSDCGKYISCNHGRPYIMPCPKGLNFSPLLRICLPPEQAQCQTN